MSSNIVDPNKYSTLQDDSAMIQAAVDEAAKKGLAVLIPRINARTNAAIWNITEEINLYTGSVIYLDNCHLRLADNTFCNIFKNSHARTGSASDLSGRQYDIRITGFGNAVLDGGEHNGHVDRGNIKAAGWGIPTDGYEMMKNICIHFHNAERITVENLRIINLRFWGVTFHYCSNVRVSNIDFECDKNYVNLDGVDLRVGCHDFIIENLSGKTGDDMLALTNLGDSKYMVEGLDTAIYNVYVRNVRAKLIGNHAIVRLLCDNGFQIYNINIDGVMDCSKSGEELHRPFAAIRIGDPFYNDGTGGEQASGDIRAVTIRNIITRAEMAVYICKSLQDALFDGIQLYGDAGTAVYFFRANAKNITFRDIQYGADSRIFSIGQDLKILGVKSEYLSNLYFYTSKCDGIRVCSLTVGQGADAVFAGIDSQAKIDLIGLYNASCTPLISGKGISVKF